jgi:hypothetical protein
MNPRERFHAVMNFQAFDRLPIVEWASWWDKTIERWHGEGLPVDCVDRYDLCRHFGLDLYVQEWSRGIHWDCPFQAPSHGAGIFEAAGEDIERIVPYLGRWPVMPERVEPWVKPHEAGECVFWFTVDGFFWLPRTVLGIERHLYAFYDQPEVMHRINQVQAEWICRYVDELCQFIQPDFMTFAEDLSYNHGPMLSKELFDAFLRPYYDMVVPHLKAKGIIPIIDSDGDVTVAADWFAEAGIEGILPLERQAGVDLAAIRRRHPRMKFIGHFDKMTMAQGEDAMRAEFERLLPVARQGGFLISCDHQTPPGVSYKNYQAYLNLFNEYANKAVP